MCHSSSGGRRALRMVVAMKQPLVCRPLTSFSDNNPHRFLGLACNGLATRGLRTSTLRRVLSLGDFRTAPVNTTSTRAKLSASEIGLRRIDVSHARETTSTTFRSCSSCSCGLNVDVWAPRLERLPGSKSYKRSFGRSSSQDSSSRRVLNDTDDSQDNQDDDDDQGSPQPRVTLFQPREAQKQKQISQAFRESEASSSHEESEFFIGSHGRPIEWWSLEPRQQRRRRQQARERQRERYLLRSSSSILNDARVPPRLSGGGRGILALESERFEAPPKTTTTTTSHQHSDNQATEQQAATTSSSLTDYERRILWRNARNYHQTEHYDHSLFGLNLDLDRAVARHQREAMLYNQDRHLKEEQAKQVAPSVKQSPVALMSINPAYQQLQNKTLCIEYPATVENLRLVNTGFSWEVKIPYQVSMTAALHGAHLQQTHRYRLDQFHCHWGDSDEHGSEHTVDSRHYSAEMHFVHYNMEKYRTLSKAARHLDGLVVLSVFIDAQPNHHNHAELEKIVSNLRAIPLKGEHAIIKQAVRIENLLPTNRSYWSYQGSLTTPPYLESVTWFILKQPIKCNASQIERFRTLKSNQKPDDDQVYIRSNFRPTQPLNGRTIVSYDEPNEGSGS